MDNFTSMSSDITSDFELSICTVSFDSAKWINLNTNLVRVLNPNKRYRWIVVENSSSDSLLRVIPGTDDVIVLDGAASEQRPYAAASYHHAAGLHLGIKAVTTRFLLVLDPDFYIIRYAWITEVLDYMIRESLSILGAPWHPSRYKKWRYFPCAHCTFYDLKRIEKELLDFQPDYDEFPRMDKKHGRLTKKLIRLFDPLKLRERGFIGHSADTGYRIFKRFYRDEQYKVACFTPVFAPSVFSKIYDAPFTDAFRLIPSESDYYSPHAFADYGLADFRSLGCEEFLWRDEPFGFHVRSFPKRHKAADSLSLIYHRIQNVIHQGDVLRG